MNNITVDTVMHQFKQKNYVFRTDICEMNVFGIRNTSNISNSFDDLVGVIYKDIDRNMKLYVYPATTDPGRYALENPMNHDGTAIIVPGQNLQCYKYGQHKGQEALEQVAPIVYVRDANKDMVLDFLYRLTKWAAFKENAKTNIHRAGEHSKLVDKWSYGCQVFANEAEFLEFLSICKKQLAYYNNKKPLFDYTLFEEKDFA